MEYYVGNGLYSDGALRHYGIKGMKWGVRRTPEELGHKKSLKERLKRKKKAPPSHDDLMKSTNPKELYKYRSQLSDKELRARVNRINTERELKKLMQTRNLGATVSNRILNALTANMVAEMTKTAIAGEKVIKEKAKDPFYITTLIRLLQ